MKSRRGPKDVAPVVALPSWDRLVDAESGVSRGGEPLPDVSGLDFQSDAALGRFEDASDRAFADDDEPELVERGRHPVLSGPVVQEVLPSRDQVLRLVPDLPGDADAVDVPPVERWEHDDLGHRCGEGCPWWEGDEEL
jgi:hypothetical protein